MDDEPDGYAGNREIAPTYKDDFAWANAEYGSSLSDRYGGFISPEVLDAVIDPDFERPHHSAFGYTAFVDPSGGSNNSMTMAISHMEGDIAVVDVIREVQAPFNPVTVTADFCGLMKKYGITRCYGDYYGAEWVTATFDQHGIFYEPCDQNRSQIYLNWLPMANSGQCALLTHERMRRQFLSLERKVGRGADTVDHPRGGRDDVCNAVAGSLVLCKLLPGAAQPLLGWGKGDQINYGNNGYA